MGTLPSRSEYEGPGIEGAEREALEYESAAPQLFDPPLAERRQRRLSKAESLAYIRSIRARLHRGESTEPARITHRRVA